MFNLWSHWGELNSRPSHYQWDAIPLSHSGALGGNRTTPFCVTMSKLSDGLKTPGRFGKTWPRSHSLVLRMTGNHVGSSLRSSNLRLGAIVIAYFLLESASPLCHPSIGHVHGGDDCDD